MFDHVELRVRDLVASKEFYRCVLEPLGIPLSADEEYVEFGALSLSPETPFRDPVHLAFLATTRGAVDAFHRAGVEAGYASNGAPGIREVYAADYYAAYLLDPDGNNVEAVYRDPATRARWSWLGIGVVESD
jgi:catechol 2,3-dioxygenase-like lactoylglutathione lyase family enzyme